MRIAPLILIVVIFADSPLIAQVSEFVFTVKVPETDTQPGRIQTGFRLNGVKGIVTALHGVVRADNFRAYNENGDNFKDLHLYKVNTKNDLALLISDELSAQDAIGLETSATGLVGPEQNLYVFGHPEGISLFRKPVNAGDPVMRQLSDLIPPSVADSFEHRKSPDPEINVLSLNGDIGPGDSGAPVLNADFKVVGIVSGGLKDGHGISWAVGTDQLTWRSADSARNSIQDLADQGDENLFAVETVTSEFSGSKTNHAIDFLMCFAQRDQTMVQRHIQTARGVTDGLKKKILANQDEMTLFNAICRKASTTPILSDIDSPLPEKFMARSEDAELIRIHCLCLGDFYVHQRYAGQEISMQSTWEFLCYFNENDEISDFVLHVVPRGSISKLQLDQGMPAPPVLGSPFDLTSSRVSEVDYNSLIKAGALVEKGGGLVP